MKETTLGDRLRLRRLQLEMSLKDVESKADVPLHYLLAIELNQLDAIPIEDVDHYISRYAKAVSLASKEDARLTQEAFEERLAVMQNAKIEQSQIQKIAIPESHEEADNESIEASSHEEGDLSRARRQSYRTLKKWFIFGALFIILVAGVALTFLWQQQSNQLPVSKNLTQTSQLSSSSESSSSTEVLPQLTLTQDENGANIATLSQAKSPITLTISLKGDSDSWVSISNTDLPTQGVLLTSENTSVDAHLVDGADSAVLVFGYPEGVEVTINGQVLDMSTVTSAANTVTLTVVEGG
ncbi:RodZ domain-containing protein [Streptococcus sp. zg-JUN1979]|uniref:RodZ domain-containing protein n=1 Tax=Streptococcus sp. zg-JUN1979 TaxID=3391450 RepID=UPI0039A77D7C